jgi:tetratricopeptide (TPR) repeat protein
MTEPDISPELRDEFNRNYEAAFEILSRHIFIQGSGRTRVGPLGKKQIKEAILMLQRSVEIWRGSWQSMWGLGKAHQALGNHLSALRWFEKALKIEETNPDVWREATIESLNLGEAEKALTFARKARELKPDDPGLHANLALALVLNKQGEEAMKEIQEACRQNPNDPVSKNVMEFIRDIVSGRKPYPEKI